MLRIRLEDEQVGRFQVFTTATNTQVYKEPKEIWIP